MKTLIALVSLLFVAGCGATSQEQQQQELGDQIAETSSDPVPLSRTVVGYNGQEIQEFAVELSDGRTITCLVLDGYSDDHFSCDWPPPETNPFATDEPTP